MCCIYNDAYDLCVLVYMQNVGFIYMYYNIIYTIHAWHESEL